MKVLVNLNSIYTIVANKGQVLHCDVIFSKYILHKFIIDPIGDGMYGLV